MSCPVEDRYDQLVDRCNKILHRYNGIVDRYNEILHNYNGIFDRYKNTRPL